MSIAGPNQVRCPDITYIRLSHDFVYLTAVIIVQTAMCWSRKVTVTMDDDFCDNALKSTLREHQTPEIFNTYHGKQYTGTVPGLLLVGLKDYFEFYNFEKPHQFLVVRTPAEICSGREVVKKAARIIQ